MTSSINLEPDRGTYRITVLHLRPPSKKGTGGRAGHIWGLKEGTAQGNPASIYHQENSRERSGTVIRVRWVRYRVDHHDSPQEKVGLLSGFVLAKRPAYCRREDSEYAARRVAYRSPFSWVLIGGRGSQVTQGLRLPLEGKEKLLGARGGR